MLLPAAATVINHLLTATAATSAAAAASSTGNGTQIGCRGSKCFRQNAEYNAKNSEHISECSEYIRWRGRAERSNA